MKAVSGCFAVAGVLLLLVLLTVGGFMCNYAGRVYDRTVSPDAMITQYEWYEQQAKDIKAAEGQIRDAEDSLKRFRDGNGPSKDWTFDQRTSFDRLNNNVTGLRAARRSMVEDYNAKAGMITRSMWKHSSLPQHIEE